MPIKNLLEIFALETGEKKWNKNKLANNRALYSSALYIRDCYRYINIIIELFTRDTVLENERK